MNPHRTHWTAALALGLLLALVSARGTVPPTQIENLATLPAGRTQAANALWRENPLSVQFKSARRIVVAQIEGPAEITMMHFAYARTQLGQDANKRLREQIGNGKPLNRDLLLRIYWDGETQPSVECPLVDFFCSPAGTRDLIDTALLNVCRGFNAYFPMPFRKSAIVELDYEGPLPPGDELARAMPCYSYVCYRTRDHLPAATGYFHASWRQETLLLGRKEYVALEARGKGKFVGWHITGQNIYRDGCPVDENEKFFIDGESTPSIEFQGLEDSFGFSWGFPQHEVFFPLTGYFRFLRGVAAYRFFLGDAISFEKSLKVTIGFGAKEAGWRQRHSVTESAIQFSSTVYWYQTEPHAPLPAMLPADQRAPVAVRQQFPVKHDDDARGAPKWPEKSAAIPR